jgi:hypothetical protein
MGIRPCNIAQQPEAKLGKLVQLPKRGRAPKSSAPPTGPAEVVLFTGVRYERNDAPTKPAGAASGGKRRRG